jgi:hypothetical protein
MSKEKKIANKKSSTSSNTVRNQDEPNPFTFQTLMNKSSKMEKNTVGNYFVDLSDFANSENSFYEYYFLNKIEATFNWK